MKLKVWMGGVVLALATPLAVAEGGGFYGALDIGMSDIADACNTVIAGQSCSKTNTASRVALGYQFSPSFAGELAFLGGAKSTFIGPGLTAEKKADLQIAMVGTWPMDEKISLLGRIGFSRSSTKYDEVSGLNMYKSEGAGLSLLLGAGMQYAINQKMAIRAQYEVQGIGSNNALTPSLPNEGATSLSLFSAGIVYRFY